MEVEQAIQRLKDAHTAKITAELVKQELEAKRKTSLQIEEDLRILRNFLTNDQYLVVAEYYKGQKESYSKKRYTSFKLEIPTYHPVYLEFHHVTSKVMWLVEGLYNDGASLKCEDLGEALIKAS